MPMRGRAFACLHWEALVRDLAGPAHLLKISKPSEKRNQRGVDNPTAVHTVTRLELTARFAKSRIRVPWRDDKVRGRGF